MFHLLVENIETIDEAEEERSLEVIAEQKDVSDADEVDGNVAGSKSKDDSNSSQAIIAFHDRMLLKTLAELKKTISSSEHDSIESSKAITSEVPQLRSSTRRMRRAQSH